MTQPPRDRGESRLKLVHVTTSLDAGGAQFMLSRLVSRLDPTRFDQSVVSLTGVEPVGAEIARSGVPVYGLGMELGARTPAALLRLVRLLRRTSPDVVQTWMYHADLIGGLAAKLATGGRVAWGIHHTNFDPGVDKPSTIRIARVSARLSGRLPDRIVCCAESAVAAHAALGYASQKMVVIPNGFDLDAFHPDRSARREVRQELGLGPETELVGLVARFHPQKDHRNFVRAAGHLHRHWPDVHFVLCGDDVTWRNPLLVEWIETAGIRGRCHLLGRRRDVARIQAALDVASSASGCGEALPLAIGEAMACGVPCVVTDVGDSALMVGDTGFVAAPRDADALADAWSRLIALGPEGRARLGTAARRRVEECYGISAVAARYGRLYEELAARANGGRRGAERETNDGTRR